MTECYHKNGFEDLFEQSESNKFKGIQYYTIYSDKRILAVTSFPEMANFEAISQGGTHTLLF